MAALILPIEAISPHAARPFGVKAGTLSSLSRAGLPVPVGFALSSETAWRHYRQVLPHALMPQQLFSRRMVDPGQLEEACGLILAGELDAETAEGLAASIDSLGGFGATGVAVRASSTAHDADAVSASRLHTATLGIRTVRSLHGAVRQAWAALFRPEVFRHGGRPGRDTDGAPGVVVQAIVPAQVSGTLFTVHPLTGDPGEMLLNAFEGPAGDRDDGDLTPDTYRVAKASGWVRDRVLAGRRTGIAAHASTKPASAKQRSRPLLDEHMLGQLIELGLAVEAHLGAPRRVGWAVDGDRLYVLDARGLWSETPGRRSPGRRRRRRPAGVEDREAVDTVWSNAFIGELVPGVATPLTWSVLGDFGQHGLREAFEALGCRSPGRLRLLANYRGRAYVNLSELHQLASRVPGLRAGVELRGGTDTERERLRRSAGEHGGVRGAVGLPRALGRFAAQQVTLGGDVAGFVAAFRAEAERMGGVDVRVLPGAALDDTLSDAHRLLDRTAALSLRAHAGLLACVTPMRAALADALGPQMPQGLWPALLSAGEPWQHADLVREASRLADVFRRDTDASAVLLAGDVSDEAQLPAGPARAALRGLLTRVGHTCVHGAELAHPRFGEDPEPLLHAVRLQLASPLPDPLSHAAARAQACRAAALQSLEGLPLGRRVWVQQLLAVARRYLHMRQQMLDCLGAALGFFRAVAVDASRRLQIREPACGPGAALMLTLPELHAALRGDIDTLSPVIQMRRAQLARERALPSPPDRFVGYPRPLSPVDTDGVSGLAAGGGQVEARVRVLRGPQDLSTIEPGEVLVAPSIDAGWAPLLTTAGGLVTERGSPLSSALFVARDLGLPAVVQAHGACDVLSTGQRVQVDGQLGTVRLR